MITFSLAAFNCLGKEAEYTFKSRYVYILKSPQWLPIKKFAEVCFPPTPLPKHPDLLPFLLSLCGHMTDQTSLKSFPPVFSDPTLPYFPPTSPAAPPPSPSSTGLLNVGAPQGLEPVLSRSLNICPSSPAGAWLSSTVELYMEPPALTSLLNSVASRFQLSSLRCPMFKMELITFLPPTPAGPDHPSSQI